MNVGGKLEETDTIVAVSSPPGTSASAVLRLSGSGALAAVRSLCVEGGEGFLDRAGFSGSRVVLDAEGCRVEAWVQVYRAPRSYTCEDLVELQLPGSPVLVRGVVKALLGPAKGTRVRLARAGEFTWRAFLHGRLDLVQAESVAQLIGSSGEEEAAAARRGLRGDLGRRFRDISRGVLELVARIEACLDFPDEDLPDLESTVVAGIGDIEGAVKALRATVAARVPTADTLRVVLAGFPNAGKSSLLNALLGRRAAITHPSPGTTRDPVRGVTVHRGRRFEWIDVAGGRSVDWFSSAEGERREEAQEPGSDPIERVVRRLTRLEVEHADRVVWVADPKDRLEDSLETYRMLSLPRKLLVLQKSDLLEAPVRRQVQDLPERPLLVSALAGEGLAALVDAVALPGEPEGPECTRAERPRFIVSSHQEAVIDVAAEALERARGTLEGGWGLECVAADLRDALGALEEVTGAHPREAILDWVFSRFCIGK